MMTINSIGAPFAAVLAVLLLGLIAISVAEKCPDERAQLMGCLSAKGSILRDSVSCLVCVNATVWDNYPSFENDCAGLNATVCEEAIQCTLPLLSVRPVEVLCRFQQSALSVVISHFYSPSSLILPLLLFYD